jgi:hypothetical protein
MWILDKVQPIVKIDVVIDCKVVGERTDARSLVEVGFGKENRP